MQHARQSIQSVLRRNVDSTATVDEVDASNQVSPFLLGEFGIYKARVLDRHVFVAECLHDPVDLDALSRQIPALQGALGGEVVPYLRSLERNVRRSLVEGRQAFVCESGDLYLPSFALALTEAAAHPQAAQRAFTAADQAVFLYGLYAERFTATDVIATTGLSSATVSRAAEHGGRAYGRLRRRGKYGSEEGVLQTGRAHLLPGGQEALRSCRSIDPLYRRGALVVAHSRAEERPLRAVRAEQSGGTQA